MSYWTYVSGVLTVKAHAPCPGTAQQLVDVCTRQLSKIVTGSERNIWFTSAISPMQDAEFETPDDDAIGFNAEYVNPAYMDFFNIIVTVHGALRDRRFEQTVRETVSMLARFSKRLWVDESLIAIQGYDAMNNQRNLVINQPDWIRAMPIENWAYKTMRSWGIPVKDFMKTYTAGTEEVPA